MGYHEEYYEEFSEDIEIPPPTFREKLIKALKLIVYNRDVWFVAALIDASIAYVIYFS